jgi:hypothetical protein
MIGNNFMSNDFLTKIIERKKEDIINAKARISENELRRQALTIRSKDLFSKSLNNLVSILSPRSNGPLHQRGRSKSILTRLIWQRLMKKAVQLPCPF